VTSRSIPPVFSSRMLKSIEMGLLEFI
jgi:hypothetical protein